MFDPHEPDDDGDEDPFALHKRLADAVAAMLCAALLPNSDDQAGHEADIALAGDLVMLRLLQHNHAPNEIRPAMQAIAAHCDHLAEMFIHAARANGVEVDRGIRFEVSHTDYSKERRQ